MLNLVNRALAVSTDLDQLEPTLDVFNDTFEISGSCIFSIREFSQSRMNFAWSRDLLDGIPEDTVDLIKRGGDGDDMPAYRFMFNQPAQRFYDEMRDMHQVESLHEMPSSIVRDILTKQGFVRRGGAALNKRGPWIDGLFCQMRTHEEAERFRADRRTDVILPVLASSVSLGRVFSNLRAKYNAALSVLSALGLGVFLIDQSGCVIEKNKEAQRILDLDDGLALGVDKRLRAVSDDITLELAQRSQAAIDILSAPPGSADGTMVINRPSGAFDFLVSVSPLEDSLGELQKALRCAFVMVIDPDRSDVLSAEALKVMGGLTETEGSVVDLLIDGLRPAEIADQRNVSLDTIKTQLKSLSQKLRCSTQADIIRVAAATQIPIKK